MDEIDDRLAKIASQHAILISGLPKDKQDEAIEGYRRLFLRDALEAGSTQDGAQQLAETVVAAIRILLQAIEISGGSDGGSAYFLASPSAVARSAKDCDLVRPAMR